MAEVHAVSLTRDDVRKGMSRLGIAPDTLSHHYLRADLRSLRLGSIERIRDFPQLQLVDFADNAIEDASPLEDLRYLTTVILRGNRVKRLPQIFAPRCGPATATADGDGRVGSVLRSADFSENEVSEVTSLRHHQFLEELYLQQNRLERISGLEGLRFLRKLDLRDNRLQGIAGLRGLPLTHLHLDRNGITELSGLESLSQLSVLTASGNRIGDLEPLRHLESLTTCDVSTNAVLGIRQVGHLAGLPLLQDLSLGGNGMAAESFYRGRVIFRLQRLTVLDGERVSAEEKVKAVNLHGGEGSELRHRAELHGKHLPGTAFVDFAPPFTEAEEPSADAFAGRQ